MINWGIPIHPRGDTASVRMGRVFRQASFPSIKSIVMMPKSKNNRKQAPRYGFVNHTGPGKTIPFNTCNIWEEITTILNTGKLIS